MLFSNYGSRGIDLSPTQARTAGARLPDLLPRHEASNSLVHISDVTEAFYNHPKLLIVALNGPVVGLTAALVAHADLIYSMPHTYLLAPFTKLGITPEGGATTTFIQRLGFAKANEALLLSKRIPCEDLARVGFVNEIFDTDSDTEKFLARVVEEVDCNFKGVHIASVLESKALIRGQFTDTIAAQTLKEALGVAASVSRAIHTRSSSKI